MQSSGSAKRDVFAEDVLEGLSLTPKQLSSKYFYDDEGSRLFTEIMKLPEYYLTRAEFEIFTGQSRQICDAFTAGVSEFDLIELGAGDGTKTAVLIKELLGRGVDFSYIPIDISREALDVLTSKFRGSFPDLNIGPMLGDYFRILETLRDKRSRRKVLMFLGSNIGNFSAERMDEFLGGLRSVMNPGDLLLIGFDLVKDPRTILRAYDDSQGITAAFNLNLLRRINRELGADFDLDKFIHHAVYDPSECAALSYLVSRERQIVHVEALGRSFEFEPWEAIFTERSCKFSPRMIENLARGSGFRITESFCDDGRLFADSLWEL